MLLGKRIHLNINPKKSLDLFCPPGRTELHPSVCDDEFISYLFTAILLS
jgi:hypothetical protein